jgi:hypothetical protein
MDNSEKINNIEENVACNQDNAEDDFKKNPKFKFYPSDDKDFIPEVTLKGELYVGQSYIIYQENISEDMKKNDFVVQVKVKITDKSKADRVVGVVKGLWGLLLATAPTDIKNNLIKAKITNNKDDNYCYIRLEFDKDLVEYIRSNAFREGDKILEKLNGRSWGVFKSKANIIYPYVKPFNEFSDKVFSYAVEGTSEQQYIEILKLVLIKELDGERQPYDVIDRELYLPFVNYLKKIYLQNLPFEFEESYEIEKAKSVISEYNGGLDKIDNSRILMQSDKVLEGIKSQNSGFFKPYFEILKIIDFDQFELSFNYISRASFLKLEVNVNGLSDLFRTRLGVVDD